MPMSYAYIILYKCILEDLHIYFTLKLKQSVLINRFTPFCLNHLIFLYMYIYNITENKRNKKISHYLIESPRIVLIFKFLMISIRL